MRSRLLNTSITVFTIFILIAFYVIKYGFANQSGIYGQSTIGCGSPQQGGDCHSTSVSSSTKVHIWTTRSVFRAGDVDTFFISVSNPSKVAAGFNVSSDTVNGITAHLHSSNLKGYALGRTGALSSGYAHNQITHFFTSTFITNTDSVVWAFVDTIPKAAGTYHLFAAGNAVNGNGTHDNGDLWNLTTFTYTVETAGVNDAADSKINVYPSPTSRFLTISVSELQDADIQISDATGNVVLNKRETIGDNSTLDLSSLANGAYFVRVLPKDGAPIVKRILLQK